MMKRFAFLILCLLVVFSGQAQTPFALKDGDRVCFVGNSITKDGRFHTYVFLYCATRFPDAKIRIFNCGVSGDVADGVLDRMDSDILVHKPTVAVVMLGMNDVNRNLYASKNTGNPEIDAQKKEILEQYRDRISKVLQHLKEQGCSLFIETPSIYDQTGVMKRENLFGVNDALGNCADYLKSVAPQYNAEIVDYWTLMKKINQEQQKSDSTYTLIGPDRVHPQSPGHMVMAYQFLHSSGAPALVSKIEIDAKRDKVLDAENADVELVSPGPSIFTINVLEHALPFPVVGDAAPALELVPVIRDLNQEILVVKGLKKAVYQLVIDDSIVGTYSSKKLLEGINLATNALTPQYRQAMNVAGLCEKYRATCGKLRDMAYVEYRLLKDYPYTMLNDGLRNHLREIQATTQSSYAKNIIDTYLEVKPRQEELNRQLDEIWDEVYRVNKPQKHIYKLVKI